MRRFNKITNPNSVVNVNTHNIPVNNGVGVDFYQYVTELSARRKAFYSSKSFLTANEIADQTLLNNIFGKLNIKQRANWNPSNVPDDTLDLGGSVIREEDYTPPGSDTDDDNTPPPTQPPIFQLPFEIGDLSLNDLIIPGALVGGLLVVGAIISARR